ncbi:lipase family protein [Rubripirellula reticaptiva]|uniref:Lipase (Class 3) n=1 Tax=Rubripirellula reticaptiva TaxID=2528013 RepID=A0A5C6EMJ7_9BACT|nr:lipase family protein [Rubripirellula reticaptiva]TWU49725.1 Lipase (class 3) [Rubripirellula reticaptiva]
MNPLSTCPLDSLGKHTRQHARFLATACELAYLSPDEAAEQFRRQLGLTGIMVSVDNTQAFVGESDAAIVVAFRGSQSPTSIDGVKDWLLTNARNFLVVPEGRIGTDFAAAGVGARFHRGFMEALAEIWASLYDRVDDVFGQKERPVWVTGHSLGGALALLCAWRMHRHFIPIHQVVTFGAPMIGNQAAADAFAREFPNQIFRYVDAGDLVPKLPMMSLLSNDYNHCQTEVLVGKSTLVKAAEVIANAATSGATAAGIDSVLDPAVADAIWNELSKGMPSHLMNNYLSRLTDGEIA